MSHCFTHTIVRLLRRSAGISCLRWHLALRAAFVVAATCICYTLRKRLKSSSTFMRKYSSFQVQHLIRKDLWQIALVCRDRLLGCQSPLLLKSAHGFNRSDTCCFDHEKRLLLLKWAPKLQWFLLWISFQFGQRVRHHAKLSSSPRRWFCSLHSLLAANNLSESSDISLSRIWVPSLHFAVISVAYLISLIVRCQP